MQEHKCEHDSPYTIENRGDGWYIYLGEDRGANPINFCPFCGKDLEKE